MGITAAGGNVKDRIVGHYESLMNRLVLIHPPKSGESVLIDDNLIEIWKPRGHMR
jgi:hypothetical protein